MENKSLTLKEFVKNTLIDINDAVTEAYKSGVSVVHKKYEDGYHPAAKTVEFDIAYTGPDFNRARI